MLLDCRIPATFGSLFTAFGLSGLRVKLKISDLGLRPARLLGSGRALGLHEGVSSSVSQSHECLAYMGLAAWGLESRVYRGLISAARR